MNKLNKLIAGIFSLALLATPAVAGQCEVTLQSRQDQFAGIPGIIGERLSDAAVTDLVARLGTPPAIENGETPKASFEVYFYHDDENGLLYIVQDGCILGTVGPGSNAQINRFLGRTGV